MSSRSTQIIGGDARQQATVDMFDQALVVMGEVHNNIHRGIFFTVSKFDIALNEGNFDVIIQVTSPIHARFTAAVSGDFKGMFYSGTEFTADTGVLLSAINRNGFSSNVSDAVFRYNPTVITIGDEQVVQFLPGGSGGNAVGGTVSSFEEWILPAGTYMLRLNNVSGQTRRVSASIEFYQPGLDPQ